jgi:hypothetical protein
MTDFDTILGQREAWHDFMLETFDFTTQREIDQLSTVQPGLPIQPQFFSAFRYDPGPTVEQAVVWNAFPKELLRRYGRDRALVEADSLWPLSAYEYDWRYDSQTPARTGAGETDITFPDTLFYRPTVEYCEWHVDRDPLSGRIRKVAFTSEPPEYWFAMFGGIVPGSAISFPGDRNLVLDLYRQFVSPQVEMEDLRLHQQMNTTLGMLMPGDYNPHNKWNTTHGIMHLAAPPNAITAEVILAGDATVLYKNSQGTPVVDPDALISGTGMGGPNRNSDPTIAATVNALARLGKMITLVNPVGLYMDHIDVSGWELPGGIKARDCVRVLRGAPRQIERLVVEVPGGEFDVSDLQIGGIPVVFGGQLAECITVKLVGAAADGAMELPRLPLPGAGFVDPANAREVFQSHRHGAPSGTVQAFVDEAGELELASRRQAVEPMKRMSSRRLR